LVAMTKRIIEADFPDVIVMASQETISPLLSENYFPLSALLEEASSTVLSDYVYGGHQYIVGITKIMSLTSVKTSVECLYRKTAVENGESLTTEMDTRRFYYGRKSTKGVVNVEAPLYGLPGGGLRMIGMHLDTKDAIANLEEVGDYISEREALEATKALPLSYISILAGDYNTRVVQDSSLGTENMDCDHILDTIEPHFKIGDGGDAGPFFKKSRIDEVLATLRLKANGTVEIPAPPVANGYIVPTYKVLKDACNGCKAEKVSFAWDFACDLKKEDKQHRHMLSMGLLDYFAVIFDETKFGITLKALTWDGQPKSDHALVTGVVEVVQQQTRLQSAVEALKEGIESPLW